MSESPSDEGITRGDEALLVYAAPREGAPLSQHPRALELGVGKVAATLALTRRLVEQRPPCVVSFGVAGAHVGGPAIGDLCVVTEDWLADEGVEIDGGFLPLEALGLGTRGPYQTDPSLTAWIEERVGGAIRRVVGATVSVCSGTDARAASLRAACPGIEVETMEGAAVGAVCSALGIPWAQLRVISNRTGDRERGGWDLEAALARLHDVMARVV